MLIKNELSVEGAIAISDANNNKNRKKLMMRGLSIIILASLVSFCTFVALITGCVSRVRVSLSDLSCEHILLGCFNSFNSTRFAEMTTTSDNNNRSPLVGMMSDMQFNKLQDSVHPVDVSTNNDLTTTTKFNNISIDELHHNQRNDRISIAKPTLIFVILFTIALFVLALLITFWSTKAVYEQSSRRIADVDDDDANASISSSPISLLRFVKI